MGVFAWPTISFFHTTHYHHGLVTSLPSHSHLCWNSLQGSQTNDVKAKILAATVNKIMAKAQEDSHPLPDGLKKVCLHPVFVFTHSTDRFNCQ